MKWLVEFILSIIYLLTLGMFTLRANFPDGTTFELEGWIF